MAGPKDASSRCFVTDQLTTADVAQLAGITPASFARQRLRGVVPEPDGYVGRTPWWSRETVERWLAERPVAAGPGDDDLEGCLSSPLRAACRPAPTPPHAVLGPDRPA